MRLKHSNKKHKIVTLAAEKISQHNTFNIFKDTNAHVGQ